uniref:Uncharacterized protein n=1 Tax=Anguilla anguilla TaxID=7936 RepID=A0A0E9XPA7_ANGAN
MPVRIEMIISIKRKAGLIHTPARHRTKAEKT